MGRFHSGRLPAVTWSTPGPWFLIRPSLHLSPTAGSSACRKAAKLHGDRGRGRGGSEPRRRSSRERRAGPGQAGPGRAAAHSTGAMCGRVNRPGRACCTPCVAKGSTHLKNEMSAITAGHAFGPGQSSGTCAAPHSHKGGRSAPSAVTTGPAVGRRLPHGGSGSSRSKVAPRARPAQLPAAMKPALLPLSAAASLPTCVAHALQVDGEQKDRGSKAQAIAHRVQRRLQQRHAL